MEKLKQVTALGIATFTDDQVRRAKNGETIKMLVDFEMKKDKWHMSLLKEADLENLKQKAHDHKEECRKLNKNLDIFTRSLGQDNDFIREAGAIHYRLNFWVDTEMVERVPKESVRLGRCHEHGQCISLEKKWHFKPIGNEDRSQELLKMKPIEAFSKKLLGANDRKNENNGQEGYDVVTSSRMGEALERAPKEASLFDSKERPLEKASLIAKEFTVEGLGEKAAEDHETEKQHQSMSLKEIETMEDAKNKIRLLQWKLADCTKQLESERLKKAQDLKTASENYSEQLELLFQELQEANQMNLESTSTEIRLQMKDLERNSDKGLVMVKNSVRDAIEDINNLFCELLEAKDQITQREVQEKVELRKKLKNIKSTLSLSLMSSQQLPSGEACNFHQFEVSSNWSKSEECFERLEEANYNEKH